MQRAWEERIAGIEEAQAAEAMLLSDLRTQAMHAREDCEVKDSENRLLSMRLRELQAAVAELQAALEAKESIVLRQYAEAAATE